MFVVPHAQIGLEDATVGGLAVKRGPAMRRGIDRHDMIRIVAQQMAQEAEVIGIGFFLEPHREGAQADHAELAQQSKGLLILGTAAAFAHGLQCGLVGTFEARKKADPARLFVKVQDVGVADDIIGAGGADDGNGNVFCDQRPKKRLPRAAG